MSTLPTTPDQVRRARAEAYLEGVCDVLDLARPFRHAFTVERDEATKSFYWCCLCGEVIVQSFGEIEGIRDVLVAHVTGTESGER